MATILPKWNDSQIKELYGLLKNQKPEKCREFLSLPDAAQKAAKNMFKNTDKIDVNKFRAVSTVLYRVAMNSTQEQFVSFCQGKDNVAVKLLPAEMEILKAGCYGGDGGTVSGGSDPNIALEPVSIGSAY